MTVVDFGAAGAAGAVVVVVVVEVVDDDAVGAGLGACFFAQPENAKAETTKNTPKTNTVSFFKIYHLLLTFLFYF
ncbi:MAG: hypothetical protein ACYCSQ_09285 [bacterium]